MSTVTLRKSEYEILKKKAEAYEIIMRVVEQDIFSPPPMRSRKAILSKFKKTGSYSKAFLEDIEHALKRSSFFIE